MYTCQWTVVKTPVEITEQQLAEFRQLVTKEGTPLGRTHLTLGHHTTLTLNSSGQLPAHSESQLQASPACRDSLGPLVLSQPSLSQSVLHQPPSAPRPPAQPHRSLRQPHTDLSVEAPSDRMLYYVYSQSI